MCPGLEMDKKIIKLEIFGNVFTVHADENIILVCEEIRNDAKEKLDGLKTADNESNHVLEDVSVFLKNSICKLLGQDAIREIGRLCSMSVTELTGILCYVISEIGAVFAKNNLNEAKEAENE